MHLSAATGNMHRDTLTTGSAFANVLAPVYKYESYHATPVSIPTATLRMHHSSIARSSVLLVVDRVTSGDPIHRCTREQQRSVQVQICTSG